MTKCNPDHLHKADNLPLAIPGAPKKRTLYEQYIKAPHKITSKLKRALKIKLVKKSIMSGYSAQPKGM